MITDQMNSMHMQALAMDDGLEFFGWYHFDA